jgi:glutamyl-tRNA reductase
MTPANCTACERCPAVGTIPPAANSRPLSGARDHARSPGGLTPICVGLSFRSASLELRERVALTSSEISAALSRFACPFLARPDGLEELAILSTCNRLELYAASSASGAESLLQYLADLCEVDVVELREHSYVHTGESAVEHLFRVSAGLDSMVIGEAQILSQVGHALAESGDRGSAGPVIAELLRDAVRTGRRARAETGINRNPATISSVAVSIAAGSVPDLALANVLIIGAGEMGRLAVQALRDRRVSSITVLGRTMDRANRLAAEFGVMPIALDMLPAAMIAADIVISATSAPQVVLEAAVVASVMAKRDGRPLVLLDIALPRDIDPAAAEIAGVTLFSIDDLRNRMQATLADRRREIPAVERIVEAEVLDYVTWLRQLEVAPVIIAVRSRAEEIRRGALESVDDEFSTLSEADRQRIDAFSRSFVQKLLHSPTIKLKEQAANGGASDYARAMRQLFGIAS